MLSNQINFDGLTNESFYDPDLTILLNDRDAIHNNGVDPETVQYPIPPLYYQLPELYTNPPSIIPGTSFLEYWFSLQRSVGLLFIALLLVGLGLYGFLKQTDEGEIAIGVAKKVVSGGAA